MKSFLVAAIIGVAAFSFAYLYLSNPVFFSMTANAIKIFTANMQNATQSISQMITTKTTATTTLITKQTSQTTHTTSTMTNTLTAEVISPTSSTSTTNLSTTTETSGEDVCKGHALCANDTVTSVVDGDTIETKKYGTIRLALVNTPEKGEDGYEEAKEFIAEYCLNMSVLIDQDDGQLVDQFNRTVAVVYCDGFNMNEEIYYNFYDSGYAEILTDYCSQSEFANEQWAIDGGCPEE
jgi:micrococcal nuclease